jgi:hypothetical protein
LARVLLVLIDAVILAVIAGSVPCSQKLIHSVANLLFCTALRSKNALKIQLVFELHFDCLIEATSKKIKPAFVQVEEEDYRSRLDHLVT